MRPASTVPRSFAAHVDLLGAFTDRVTALPPAAWERLRVRCAPLDGVSPTAILARVELFSAPFAFHLPGGDDVPVTRAIGAVIGGVQQAFTETIGLALELAFTVAPSLDEPTRPLTRTTGRDVVDRCIDATYRIDSAVRAAGPRHAGLARAFDAAARAILRRDWLTDAQFQTIYRWIEPEIPVATFDDRSA